jgi:hypothetical protein
MNSVVIKKAMLLLIQEHGFTNIIVVGSFPN